LLLWGREDQVTPLHFGERLERNLGNATLVVLPQCGHMPMIEARGKTIDALRTFLLSEVANKSAVPALPEAPATAAPTETSAR
jgi:hypothetical protein